MKSTRLWIADSEQPYTEAFCEYVNLKKGHLFQVRVCAEPEQLEKAFTEGEVEMLLISAEMYGRCRDFVRHDCLVFLSEGTLPKELSVYPAVYKYQSVENILRELMYYYSEQETGEEYLTGIRRDNRVIGVYPPAGGIEQNKFALTLGQILAENQNVLYLNLEETSGFAEIFGGSHWNLSDLIYYLRQNKTPFLYRLNSMVQKLDRMDYVPPCDSYTDFQQIATEEWQKLIYLIRTQSSYDSIILELGDIAGHDVNLLRQCDGIYVPVCHDIISQAKTSEWEKYIQISDSMDILENLQKLELPDCGRGPGSEEDLLMLPQQELGRYVRGLLKE